MGNHNNSNLFNRAFLGEAPFTTIYYNGREFLFLKDHLNRLYEATHFVFGYPLPKKVSNEIKEKLNILVKDKNFPLGIRITLYKIAAYEGLLSDKKGEIKVSFSSKKLNKRVLKPVVIKVSKRLLFETLKPSYVKIGSYFETILELKKLKEKGPADLLFLDHKKNICECSTSNIFFIKGNTIYTPSLNSLVLDGITRKNVISFLKKKRLKIIEKKIPLKELKSMKSAFLTNSLTGIRDISQIGLKKFNYDDDFYKQIKDEFNLLLKGK